MRGSLPFHPYAPNSPTAPPHPTLFSCLSLRTPSHSSASLSISLSLSQITRSLPCYPHPPPALSRAIIKFRAYSLEGFSLGFSFKLLSLSRFTLHTHPPFFFIVFLLQFSHPCNFALFSQEIPIPITDLTTPCCISRAKLNVSQP